MQTYYKRYDIRKMDINEIDQILSSNEYLIDLRSETEFKEGRIPNSINVPFLFIKDWAKNIRSYHSRIYLYCQNGARSVLASSILKKSGFIDVVDIGGLNAYKGRLVTDKDWNNIIRGNRKCQKQ